MKYAKIYAVLNDANLSYHMDRSGWRALHPTWMDNRRPLWIVAESEKLNLRMWIEHEYGVLRVTTTRLHIPEGKKAQGHSIYKTFRNQREMAAYLRELLFPDESQAA